MPFTLTTYEISTMVALPFYISAILAVTNAFVHIDHSCDTYLAVRLRFMECMYSRNFTDIDDMLETMLDDGIITGNKVLAKLTEICSDTAVTEGVTFCMNRIITECPELQNIVHDVIENKFSFFCENNQPSSAIRDVLQNGFKFRGACLRDNGGIRQDVRRCLQEASDEILGEDTNTAISDLSMSDAMSVAGEIVPIWFQCTVEGTREELLTELGCGSTRRDILLRYWLFLSGKGFLTPTVQWSQLEYLAQN